MKKYFQLIVTLLLVFVLVAALFGCKYNTPDNPPEPPAPEFTLTLDKTELTIVEDEFAMLTATPSDPSQRVKFTVADGKIAAVSSGGRVIGKNVGQTTVTATSNGVEASCKVTVVAAQENGTKIVAQNDTLRLSMKSGATQDIVAKVYVDGKESDNASFEYISSDPAIATVDENGTVTPVAVGSAIVTVKSGDVVTYVSAEVYTLTMATVDDWTEMLRSFNDVNARFYLLNNLDFSGVAYRTYTEWSDDEANDNFFMGELDGGGHTVSNVTFDNAFGEQSMFGVSVASYLHDIAFTNVKFNGSRQMGLYSSTRHVIDNGSVVSVARINNVVCDFVYSADATGETCGIAGSVYGLNMDNVFVNMRRSDGSAFDPTKHYAIADEYYIWYNPNAISNVVFCANGGSVNAQGQLLLGSINLVSDTYFVCDSIIDATYKAFNVLNRNVFDITPGSIPTFK